MFNPSELEGEVDHTFFDSDDDDGSISRDGMKRMDRSLKVHKESVSAHEKLPVKLSENETSGWNLKTDKSQSDSKQEEIGHTSGAEINDNSCQERCSVSDLSSVALTSDEIIRNGIDGKGGSNLQSNGPSGTFMAPLAEANNVDGDCLYHRETKEALLSSSKYAGMERRDMISSKKLMNNCQPQSPSPSSIVTNVDLDSACSNGSSSRNGRNNSASADITSHDTPSSPLVRRARAGSAGSQGLLPVRPQESDSSVTDVSPLSSPDISPVHSLDLNHKEVEVGSLKNHPRERLLSSGPSSVQQVEDSDLDEDDCSLSLDSQHGGKLICHHSGRQNRKNYSFSNDEVRRIDHENQRLLRALSRVSVRSTASSAVGPKAHTTKHSPLIRPSHSAVNRQREQQRIERENLAFLKRLQSVKPTRGLRRSQQLADYQRSVGYLGSHSFPSYNSTAKTERSVSKTSTTMTFSPAGTPHRKTRADSTRCTPVPTP